MGKMTPTLEDVEYIMSIPIDGAIMKVEVFDQEK